MGFQVGDRVISLVGDFPGLEEGELGTIVEFDDFGEPIIRWDRYNDVRHNADGVVTSGHGWFVDRCMICHVEPPDLGEFPENNSLNDFLFGT